MHTPRHWTSPAGQTFVTMLTALLPPGFRAPERTRPDPADGLLHVDHTVPPQANRVRGRGWYPTQVAPCLHFIFRCQGAVDITPEPEPDTNSCAFRTIPRYKRTTPVRCAASQSVNDTHNASSQQQRTRATIAVLADGKLPRARRPSCCIRQNICHARTHCSQTHLRRLCGV